MIAASLKKYAIMSAGNEQCWMQTLHDRTACRQDCARFVSGRAKPVHRGNTRCFRDALLEYKSIIEKRTA